MHEKTILTTNFGSSITFKNYSDDVIIESITKQENGTIIISPLKEDYYHPSFDVFKFRSSGKSIFEKFSRTEIIFKSIDEAISEIDKLTDFYDCLLCGRTYYNRYITVQENAIVLCDVNILRTPQKIIDIAKLSKRSVICSYTTNNDDRIYIPVSPEDTVWDVIARSSLYIKAYGNVLEYGFLPDEVNSIEEYKQYIIDIGIAK